MKYMLDTHTWVWWNMRPQNLSRKVTKLIENTSGYDELLLSAISTLEFSKLVNDNLKMTHCDHRKVTHPCFN
jgi:PIN domain nuclease of toxin-antitoxin system